MSVSQTITVTIANVLEVPVISSNGGGDTADIAVDENVSSAITTVTATDPDGSGLDFKVTGGADSGLFALNKDTRLTFSKPPDHEQPADVDADNVYEVIVSAIGKVKADLVSASFDSDSQGFTHQKDPLGTNRPDLSQGSFDPTGGFSGGALRARTGPGEGGNDSGNLSGGWTREISLTEATDIEISLRYRLTMGEGLSPMNGVVHGLQIAGIFFGNDGSDYLIRMTGNGNGGGTEDTGWKQDTFDINLPAGTHTIAFGAYNNKSTAPDEIATAWLDDFTVRYAASDRQTLSITVRNLDEAPTDIIFPSAPIPEGQPIGRELGTLIAIDGDGPIEFDPMDGLEAWYDFENVTSNAVPDRNDKYPATLYNGAAVSPVGRFGAGISIPTTGPGNDRARLQINNATGIDVDGVWTGSLGLRSFILKGSGVHFSKVRVVIMFPSLTAIATNLVYTTTKRGRGWISSGFEMKVGDYLDWHHLVIVADGTKSDFYIDGNHVAWGGQVSKTDISIIGNYASGDQRFSEFLDDVRIYKRAFDSGEVQQLYLSGTQTTSLETHTFSLVSGNGGMITIHSLLKTVN